MESPNTMVHLYCLEYIAAFDRYGSATYGMRALTLMRTSEIKGAYQAIILSTKVDLSATPQHHLIS
ncbi:hypothetical protein Plhal304r1_c014g0052181 [Plasmopara halstedii]